MSLKSFIQNTVLLFFDICFPLVSLHFCDTFHALLRGNFECRFWYATDKVDTQPQHTSKKERNIP